MGILEWRGKPVTWAEQGGTGEHFPYLDQGREGWERQRASTERDIGEVVLREQGQIPNEMNI